MKSNSEALKVRKLTKYSSFTSNNKTFSSPYGWVIFLAGIFISTFVGGGVRAFLSSTQISSWIEKKIIEKKPKFNLGIDHVEFKLSDGWLPRFGFQAKNLWISSKDFCQSNSDLTVTSIYLPIKINSLFKGQIQFSDILFENSKLQYKEPICNSETEFQVTMSSPLDAFKIFMNKRFMKELKNSRQWFETMKFDNLLIEFESEGTRSLIFENVLLDITQFEKKLFLNGEWQPSLSLKNFELWKSMPFQLIVTDELITLNGQGKLREGELNFNGSLKPDKGDYALDAQSKYLPFQELLKVTSSVLEAPDSIESSLSWITCSLKLSGNIYDYKSSRLSSELCNLKGDSGSIDFGKINIQPFSISPEQSIKVVINNFSGFPLLQLLRKRFDSLSLDRILNPGKVNGEWIFTKEKSNFAGEIKDLEFIFVKDNKKRIQIIRKLPFELVFRNKRLSGQFERVELDGGEFEGVVSFNFDNTLQTGLVQTSLKKLKLNRYVNQLFHTFDHSPIELYSQMRFKNLELEELQGVLGIQNVANKDIGFHLFKADLKYIKPKWDVRVKTEKVNLFEGRLLSEQLAKLTLSEEPITLTQLENLRFTLLKSNNLLEIQNLLATNVNNSQSIWGELKIENDNVNGAIKISTSDSKLFWWDLVGDENSFEFVPTMSLLKAIRPKHSVVNLGNKMSILERQEVFNKILNSREGKPIQSFTDKLKELAKSWIPDFSKKETP